MALRHRLQVANPDSAAAKTSPFAAKTPQSFRIRRRPCRENGDSLENALPCVLASGRKRGAIRVPRIGASFFYPTHGKYFAATASAFARGHRVWSLFVSPSNAGASACRNTAMTREEPPDDDWGPL